MLCGCTFTETEILLIIFATNRTFRVLGGMVKPLSQDWELAVRPHRAPSVVSLSKALYPHCNFSTDFHQGRSGKRNTQEGLGSI